MKVLMLNGSRRNAGCTYTALSEIATILNEANIETEILSIGSEVLNGDLKALVNDVHNQLKLADGLIVGTPVYFASPSGEIITFLDHLFTVAVDDLRLKPAAAIASARRGGTTASIDVINKYFMFAEMPIVSSRYWNIVHGNSPEEVKKDEEGMQIMRVLGRNMAWLLKCIDQASKAGVEKNKAPKKIYTNFIR